MDFQGNRQVHEHRQRGTGSPPFYIAQIGHAHPGPEGKLLLSQAFGRTRFFQKAAELLTNIHARKTGALLSRAP